MKQPQSNFIEEIVTTLIAAFFSFGIVAVIFSLRKVLWPIVCFCGKAALKGLKHGASAIKARAPAAKQEKVKASLPTPDIFKGAPNLAPARQLRF